MTVLYVVLPLALLIAAAAVWGFSWAVRRGQFDDLDTPSQRMLLDDDPVVMDPLDAPASPDRLGEAPNSSPSTEPKQVSSKR